MFKLIIAFMLVVSLTGCNSNSTTSVSSSKFDKQCIDNVLYFLDAKGRPSTPVISSGLMRPSPC
jgi:hypothetical protein